ncbi:MAG: aryl-sulfate sulfotransferase [Myxococcota bacterium]
MWLLPACAETSPAPTVVTDVTVEDVPGNALRKLVHVELPEAAAVEVVCEADGERLVWRDDAVTTTHAVRAVGLLAETEFACTVAETPFTLRTDALPATLPVATVTGETADWTLFNHEGLCAEETDPEKLMVVDAAGRVRWYETFHFAGADLEARWLGGDRVLAGGRNLAPVVLDTWGETTWASGLAGEFHHDVDVVGDDVLALSVAEATDGAFRWDGFAVTRVAPDGAVTWAWDSQAAVDAGTLPPGEVVDPWHANDVTWIDDGVWVSLHYLSQVVRVDVATGLVDHKVGEGGDFVLTEGTWFSGVHAPEWDGDRLMLYDNRAFVGDHANTRVVEYVVDLDAKTARQTWEWSEEAWHDLAFGDVDRLADGHVLVTMGHAACWFGDDGRVTSIVEVDPATGAVTWRADFGVEDVVYRSQRIDACEMFGGCR